MAPRFALKHLAALFLLLLLPAAGWAESLVTLTGHVPEQIKTAVKLSSVPANETIELSLVVRVDQNLLDQTLKQIYAQPLAQRQYLTSAEFARKFDLADKRQRIKDFAQANGLTIDETRDNPNGLAVKVYGPASSIEQAFHIQLNTYRGADGRIFRGHETDPQIPASLAPHLAAVLGLSNATLMRPLLRLHRAGAAPSVAGSASPASLSGMDSKGGLSPSEIKTVYGLSGSLDGSSQTVALVEFDGYNPSDIAEYESEFGLGATTITFMSVGGQGNLCGSNQDTLCSEVNPSDDNGMIEVALDIEMVLALAPHAKILVYEAKNGSCDPYEDIESQDAASVVSTSWGDPQLLVGVAEMDIENVDFENMAAKGQSMFSAAGDNGAYDNGGETTLSVDDPGSQPYVTGVGGTSLSGTVGGSVAETVWNNGYSNGAYEAGGGGVADYDSGSYWTLPSYQSGVSGEESITYRNDPDVALNADPDNSPYSVYVGGSWYLIGGTSAASPLWAAMTALINEQRANLGYSSTLGFANDALYPLAGGASYSSAFNDITSGDNGHYYAGTGYDNASGWGSFKANVLIGYLSGVSGPADLAVSDLGVSSIAWTWSDAGQPAQSSYTAEISTNDFSTINAALATYNTSVVFGTSGAGSALIPATTYYFRVQASGEGVTGVWANLGPTYTLAEPPISFALGQVWSSSMTMNWAANGNPAGTQYRLDYYQVGFSTQSFYTTSTAPTLTGLAEGATYWLTVGALNGAGTIAWDVSQSSTVMAADASSQPILITSTGGVISYPTSNGTFTLQVPAGALSQSETITLQNPTSCPEAGSSVCPEAGSSASSAAGNLTATGLYVQICGSGVDCPEPAIEPSANTTLSINYKSAYVKGMDPNEFVVARCDTTDHAWVPLVSSVDAAGQTVTGVTSHWSLFGLMQNAAAEHVQSAMAYPNPWRISQGPATMTFSQLPAGARLRIYTLSGRIVKDMSADASGMASWDGANEAGRPVASGFYFLLTQGPGGQKILKLVIQR